MWEDDICYCMSECDHTECFRHESNCKSRIYTASYLKDTEYCPLIQPTIKEEELD